MDDHMLQNQISRSQKLCLHRPGGNEQAQVLLKRFRKAFPEMRRVRMLVIDRADYSAIERGIEAHKAIEAMHSTLPCVIGIDLAVEDDAEVLKGIIKKLSEERADPPDLVLKNYDNLTPVDTYKPEKFKKTPSFRDKKYF